MYFVFHYIVLLRVRRDSFLKRVILDKSGENIK